MASVIKTCDCKNSFQDKKYGKKRRVWNQTVKGYRCTVCRKEVGA